MAGLFLLDNSKTSKAEHIFVGAILSDTENVDWFKLFNLQHNIKVLFLLLLVHELFGCCTYNIVCMAMLLLMK